MKKFVIFILFSTFFISILYPVQNALNDEYFQACQEGNYKKIKLLLKKGADVDYYPPRILFYFRPLTLSMSLYKDNKGFKEIIKLLIDNNANVNQIKEKDLFSPLFLAIIDNNDIEIINYLIKKGANVNEIMNYDSGINLNTTALFAAIISDNIIDKKRYEIIKILLENKAEANIKIQYTKDVLATTCLIYVLQNNYDDKYVKLLLEYGTDINFRIEENQTLLMYCIKNKLEDVAKKLINLNCDINYANDSYENALSYSLTENSNDEITKILIQKGATLNKNFITRNFTENNTEIITKINNLNLIPK